MRKPKPIHKLVDEYEQRNTERISRIVSRYGTEGASGLIRVAYRLGIEAGMRRERRKREGR
jgi:hypothetical protein